MDSSNQCISKELLKLSKVIIRELQNVRGSAEDDDFDDGFKEGERKSLTKVNEMILTRIERLLADSEQNK